VVLAQELQVAGDYMYLQKMRFGSRIDYSIKCKVDKDLIMIPSFCLQPLLENSIIHGISKKEEGGKIFIDIRMKAEKIIITIVDTGIGMTQEELESLRLAIKQGTNGKIGIGLGNIYKRIKRMYFDGDVKLLSRKNQGTIVRVAIPHKNREG
ncbi:two-component sensor histidine kinase, partial [Lachnotalea glycerini]